MATTATAMYDENSPFNVWADKWFLYKSVGISDGYKSAISSQVGIFLITSEIHL